MVIDPASVNKKVDMLSKRVDYLEDQLSKIYVLLKNIDKDLVFFRDDKEVRNG